MLLTNLKATGYERAAQFSAADLTESKSAAAVRCLGVTKTFGAGTSATRALRGVDVEVLAGRMTLLVGPSGCGKTTLISIIAGLLDPSSGSVMLFDQNLTRMSARELVRFRATNIGFVFQQFNLLPALTAAENTAVPLLVRGIRRSAAVRRARELLAEVSLADRADALPSQLSGGQQQRVAIARALVNEPRLLVCDEPTAALDSESGQTVMRLFRQVAIRDDRVVIIVTHDNRIFSYGDPIVRMNDGRVDRVERRAAEAEPAAGDARTLLSAANSRSSF
jgi:putative ABC transport system ATP-binding protein